MNQYLAGMAAAASTGLQTQKSSNKVSMTVSGKVVQAQVKGGGEGGLPPAAVALFATWDAVRQNEASVNQKLSALKTDLESLSETLSERVDAHEQIIMRMAHQVDVLQSEVRSDQRLQIQDVEALLQERQFATRAGLEGIGDLVVTLQGKVDSLPAPAAGGASEEQIKAIQKQLQDSHESIANALSAADTKVNKRVDLQEKVIMRIAQQVDVLQKGAKA